MADYYELLGVERDASKDDIRDAYQERRAAIGEPDTEEARRELAQLNDAWQTLADPYQRGRHDAALDAQEGDDIEVVGDDSDGVDDAPEPPRRRGLFGPPPEAERAARAEPVKPTIDLPVGVALADNRSRINAMVFDLAILMLLFVTSQIVGQQVIENRYPDEVDELEVVADQIDYIDDELSRRDSIDDEVQDLESDIEAAEEAGEPTGDLEAQLADVQAQRTDASLESEDYIADLQDELDDADLSTEDRAAVEVEIEDRLALVSLDDDQLDERRDELESDAEDILGDLRVPQLLAFSVAVVAGLVYLVGFSLSGGRTLGKRLRKIRVVQVDGSPLRFSSSLVRYGIPALVTALTLQFLGFLGFALGLVVVLAWMRNPNKQGLHDRAAKTIVVSD